MRFEELVRNMTSSISFEGISEPRTSDVRLRILVNMSQEPSDLLIFPNTQEKVTTLEIEFENYVTYSVIYDDFTVWDEQEKYAGKAFRIYHQSKWLEYIATTSHLPKNELTHYSLACLEHHVSIIVWKKKKSPQVKVLSKENQLNLD